MRGLETDVFSAFSGAEHMFFALKDPFGMIRQETEAGLRRQVVDAVLERIETFGEPKFLTLGRKTQDPSKVVVAHFAFSVLARLHVNYAGGAKREVITAALTFMFGNVDVPEPPACRTYFDLHRDAQLNFTDDRFEERFLTFRTTLAQSPA
jgi:hypothetical protein